MSDHSFAVLIVDDDKSQAEGLAEWIQRKEKVEVEVATSGEDALDLMRRIPGKYGVVLLDQIFPTGLAGEETLHRIKDEFPNTLVVMITQAPEERLAGAFRCISKPINNQEVGILVWTAGEIWRMERQAHLEHLLAEAAGRISEQVTIVSHDEIMKQIAIEGQRLLHTAVCIISELDPKDRLFKAKFCDGIEAKKPCEQFQFDSTTEATKRFIKQRKPMALPDIQDSPWYQHKERAKAQGWVSLLSVPIAVQDRVFAVMDFYTREHRVFSEPEMESLAAFARQVAVALRQASLLKHEQEISRLALQGDYGRLTKYIVMAVSDLTGTDVSLWMIEQTAKGPMLRIEAGQGLLGDYQAKARLTLNPKRSVVAACIADKVPQAKRDIFDDTEHSPFHYKKQAKLQDWKSFLAVPLLSPTGAPLGALSVYSSVERDFSEMEKSLLSMFANQAATALENIQHQESLKQLERIGQITLGKITDEITILKQYVKSACDLTGAPCAVIYPYDAEKDEFYVADQVVALGLIKDQKEVSTRPRKKGLAGIVRQTGAIVVNDVKTGDIAEVNLSQVEDDKGTPLTEARLLEFIREAKFVRRERVRAFVAVSLRATEDGEGTERSTEVGVLYINYRVPHKFTDHELSLIQLFAQQVAGLIRAARLRKSLEDLNQISSQLAEAADLTTVENRTADYAMSLLKADAIVLYRYDRLTDNVVVPPTHRGVRNPSILGQPGVHHENSVPRQLIHSGKSHYADRAKEDKVMGGIARSENAPKVFVDREEIVSSAGVVLKVMDEIIGVFFVNYRNDHHFDRTERDKIELFANHAAVAIQNALRLEEAQRLRWQMEDQLRAVSRIHETIGTEMTDPTPIILEEVTHLFGAHYGSFSTEQTSANIFLYNEKLGFTEGRAYGPLVDLLRVPPRPHGTGMHVVETGEPYYVDDAGNPPKDGPALRQDVLDQGVKSFAALPLKWQNRILGVLFISIQMPTRFSAETRRILQLFAGQGAIAIENAHRFEQERTLRLQADTLREVSRAISAELKLDEAAATVLAGLAKVVEYSKASVQVIDGDVRRQIAIAPSTDKLPPPWLMQPLSQDAFINRIIARKEPLIISDLSDPEKVPGGWIFFSETAHIKSWAGVPLVYGDRVIGLLTLDYDKPGYYTQAIQDLLVAFGNQAAIAIENAKLYQMLEQRTDQQDILLRSTERLITEGVRNVDRLLDLLYEVACKVMDLHDAQVQFAFYDADNDEVTFPLAVEQDKETGGEIDRVRLGKREARFVREGEKEKVQQLQPRSFKARVGLTEYVIHKQEPVLILSDFQRTAEAFIIRDDPLFVVEALDTGCIRQLDATRIPEELRDDFSEHGFALGPEAYVEVKCENQQWAVTDSTRNYLIERIAQLLKVYSRVKVWPTFGRLDRPTHSWLGVPMVVGGRVIGIISIQSLEQERAFDNDQVDLLATVANQAAVAIENARLYAASLEQQARIADVENVRVRNQVASDLVHELNNRLGTIPVRVSLIRESLDDRSARDLVVRHLEGIAGDAKRVMTEAKHIQMVPVPEVIDDLCMMLEAILEEALLDAHRPIKSTLCCSSKLPPIRATRVNLATALRFVVDNAIQAIEETGDNLIIEATEVYDEQGHQEIRVRISNDGPPIPKDVREKLFRSGFTTKERGTGYGLWRARDLIQDMDGRLVLEEPGLDNTITTFGFFLPVLPALSRGNPSER